MTAHFPRDVLLLQVPSLIVYRLVCSTGHEFEGWFKDSAAFDAQAAQGALECPVCCDSDVKKAIMAPALRKPAQLPAPSAPQPAPDMQKVRQFMAG